MGSPDGGAGGHNLCADKDLVVFCYCERDVEQLRDRPTGRTKAHYSEFDSVLCSHWDKASLDGVFRYTLDDVNTRVIHGSYGFVAQRNPKRFSHRRKPNDMHSITQPFDHDTFNFNKINKKEILMELKKDTHHGDTTKCHWLVINVSPIDYGHVLLIPEPQSCLPQVMTQDSIQVCLDIVTMSGHSGFCMVANSLLAFASVNHLHYHFMYISHPLLAATVVGRPFTKHCYELITHPCPGFGFELNTSTADCARAIFNLVSLLIELNIPHNLVMLRGTPFNQESSSGSIIRTLLLPRKPAHGLKSVYESSQEVPPFFAAACELGMGFIPVIDQTKYDTLSEEDVLKIIHKYTLSQDEFKSLRTKAMEKLESIIQLEH